MQKAMCSSRGTPSSSAPWRTSSRFTPRANALSLSFFLTEETSRSERLFDGRTNAQATRKPHNSDRKSTRLNSSHRFPYPTLFRSRLDRPERLNAKGDVLVEGHTQLFRPLANFVAVHTTRERLVLELLLNRGNLEVGKTFRRAD